jgi:hypothetical protein
VLLTRASPPNIAPPDATDNRLRAESPPRRDELQRAPGRLLQAGGPTKADLRVVDLAGRALVVKDFAHKRAWVRALGRLQIARECRAYRHLGPLPGLARFVGRVDAHALAVAWIDGDPLARSERRLREGAVLLERLAEIVARMHAAGLAHLDLRGRENVMIDGAGRLHVLDLASAVWLRPGGLAHRLFFGWLAATDRAALLKWKRLLSAGPYTDAELEFLRRFRFWRSLWIFNPKRPRDGRGRS